MFNPQRLYRLGMQPWSPRWLKMWCLRMIMRYVAREINRKLASLSQEQRDKINAMSGKLAG
jgi:hypothetical protein